MLNHWKELLLPVVGAKVIESVLFDRLAETGGGEGRLGGKSGALAGGWSADGAHAILAHVRFD
jgi:hypothetical protein